MQHDLVVRNGTVVDGSGLPGFRADVAVHHGHVVSIGRVRGRGRQELDAEGHSLAEHVREGQRDGSIRPDVDPVGVACEVLAFVQGAQLDWLRAPGDTPLKADIAAYVSRLADDIGVSSASPRARSGSAVDAGSRSRRASARSSDNAPAKQ